MQSHTIELTSIFNDSFFFHQKAGFLLIELAFAQTIREKRHVVTLVCEYTSLYCTDDTQEYK